MKDSITIKWIGSHRVIFDIWHYIDTKSASYPGGAFCVTLGFIFTLQR